MSFQLAQVNMMLRTGPAESSEDRCMEKNISHALKWVQVVRSNCLSCFFFFLFSVYGFVILLGVDVRIFWMVSNLAVP